MELIKNFGLDPVLLAAQIVNILIILFLLKRFLYKPMLVLLKKRQDTIKEGLEKAEEGKLALEQALEKEKSMLQNAKVQARKLLEDARNQSEELLKQSKLESKAQTEKMIGDAKKQIEKDAKDMQEKLMKHVAHVSVELLEKSLSGLLNEKAQLEVVKKAASKLHTRSN